MVITAASLWPEVTVAVVAGVFATINTIALLWFNARRETLIRSIDALLDTAVKHGDTEADRIIEHINRELHAILDPQTRGYYFGEIVRRSVREVLGEAGWRRRQPPED